MRFRLPTRTSLVRHLLILLASWGVAFDHGGRAFILSKDPDPDHRAIIKMGIGLILVWCVVGGLVMYRFRDGFVAWATRIPLGWRTRFVLLCIVFAMLEEAVTTSLTNLAPLLGGVTDAARITASKNYLEVVLLQQRDRLRPAVPLLGLVAVPLRLPPHRSPPPVRLERDACRDDHLRSPELDPGRDVGLGLRADGVPARLHGARGARGKTRPLVALADGGLPAPGLHHPAGVVARRQRTLGILEVDDPQSGNPIGRGFR